jgi:hypothetical protein
MKSPAWLDIRMGSVVASPDGPAVEAYIRIRWWHPSFWREVRAMVDVEPRWLTWPLVLWFVARHGWKVNRRL